ncbi:MAG: asparaginase [Oscillospiraceae bacterium]
MREILLITTGGTIACPDTDEGRSPVKSAQSLLSKLNRLPEECEISAMSPFSLDSTNMTPARWITLAEIIHENYERFDGFVITHGTDTLGYAAAALSCLIRRSAKPVVLTGSMLPMETEGTDARGNLRNALFFACDKRAAGVCVVFGKFAYDGRHVSKIHSTAAKAFESVNYPPIACFDERGITFTEGIPRSDGEVRFYDVLDERLEVVFLVPGVKPPLIREETRAVIVRGFGTGGLPEVGGYDEWLAGLLSRGVVVIMGTQVLRGGSNLSVYEVGSRLPEQVIDAGKMSIEYASMKAMWALSVSTTASEFKQKFLSE